MFIPGLCAISFRKNTIEDIADAANYALAKQNLPTHGVDVYMSIVGNGIGSWLLNASNFTFKD